MPATAFVPFQKFNALTPAVRLVLEPETNQADCAGRFWTLRMPPAHVSSSRPKSQPGNPISTSTGTAEPLGGMMIGAGTCGGGVGITPFTPLPTMTRFVPVVSLPLTPSTLHDAFAGYAPGN